ncbi:hypothetical protein EIN_345980 [Entamoeba invadens IP1]|uniref:Rho GTPase n=1 Tax=Entamoeba invadens IP1 TaxID=370355 RepID=L7FJC3_ENTIV|nr:hypothetical protein EIN_345980 [Entamoeba invadens IP1]ELP84012.1 hypothetical protein EIN_345980 [Entamoeba invadens IP1]|eukprot:XP_004183358.1 hypothetical protein EIN_345980 [Entamoeba invadens IP1]
MKNIETGCKVLVVGGDYVGKSSLEIQICTGHFVPNYQHNPMADMYSTVEILNNYKVHLFFIAQPFSREDYDMDTYKYAIESQYPNALAFVFCYSITSSASFEEVKVIKESVWKMKKMKMFETLPAVLCGTKCDLENEREVTTENGEELANEWGMPFFECSAKLNINVKNVSQSLAHLVIVKKNSNWVRKEKTKGCFLV